MIRHLSLSFTLMLAALGGVVGDARAQSAGEGDTAVLPVWNNASGKVEAVLVLEPANGAEAGGRFRFGNSSLDAAFGLDAGDSLALLCDRKTGVASAIGNLPNNCLLAALNPILNLGAIEFAAMLGGAIITESIFGLDGIGRAAAQAANSGDAPVVIGTTLVGGVVFVVATFLVDLVTFARSRR